MIVSGGSLFVCLPIAKEGKAKRFKKLPIPTAKVKQSHLSGIASCLRGAQAFIDRHQNNAHSRTQPQPWEGRRRTGEDRDRLLKVLNFVALENL